MIKGSIQESTVVINIYAHNTGAAQYIKQILIAIKEEVDSNTIFSHVWLFVTPWTAAHQASLSIANSQRLLKLISIASTLCDPIDGSPPDFPVPGILQARTLEWIAISFSNTWKWRVKVKLLSCVRLLVATPWTTAYQAPPSMGFSRQEYWSGVPLPSLIHWVGDAI